MDISHSIDIFVKMQAEYVNLHSGSLILHTSFTAGENLL